MRVAVCYPLLTCKGLCKWVGVLLQLTTNAHSLEAKCSTKLRIRVYIAVILCPYLLTVFDVKSLFHGVQYSYC